MNTAVRVLELCDKCGERWCRSDGNCAGCEWNAKNYISIDEDTGHCATDGLWRSFQLVTDGVHLSDLLENASISEIDQDGGSSDCFPLQEYDRRVIETCERIIARAFLKSREGTQAKSGE